MAVDQKRDHSPATPVGNVTAADALTSSFRRLRLSPNMEHRPDNYDDLPSEFNPLLFSWLERYLPPPLLNASRDEKAECMMDIMLKYSPDEEKVQARKQDYRQKIIANYQPLHKELYSVQGTNIFVPSFVKAIYENTEESFRSIMSEPVPGIFIFEMLEPGFCRLLLEEVEHFQKWVNDNKVTVMQPNALNKYGAVLDDFGLDPMLDKLMQDFVLPISKVFFPDVGGSSLDSHHGFVIEYGIDRDVNLGFHVDDAEVTLNICLGNQFSGGELLFRGIRCEKHVNTGSQTEEKFDYSHVPGRAILHHGRHRRSVGATTGGHRINLVLWCRSSMFRELKKYQKDFPSWCGECKREKKERQQLSMSAIKQELLKEVMEPSC